MVPSNVHEGTAAAITEELMPLMQAQRAQNHELLKHWRLHHNKAAYYEKALDGSTKFQPDVGFYYSDDGIFFVEVEFTQPWEDLVQKVEHMVQGQECWGVLAVMIKEGDRRGSLPKRRAATGDFVAKADWFAQAEARQVNDPYGPVSINGTDWTKAVEVELCFFPHGWIQADGPPTKVCSLANSTSTGSHI
jgi:hypothetical protein